MKKLNLFLMVVTIGLFIAGIFLFANLRNIESYLLTSIIQLEDLYQKERDFLLDDFTKCLAKKGVKFYGIASDGPTQNQKSMFKEAVKYLPYVECQESETKQLTFECQIAEIETFPTWEFPTGKKIVGETSLRELSKLSGCSLLK